MSNQTIPHRQPVEALSSNGGRLADGNQASVVSRWPLPAEEARNSSTIKSGSVWPIRSSHGDNEAREQPGHKPGAYREFLGSFIEQGYRFPFFHQLDPTEQGQALLRHDIDFSTHAALEMAETEAMLGVRASYFFLLGSKMYNLLGAEDSANVLAIRALGHEVSLHFDASIYPDVEAGLRCESEVFKAFFSKEVKLISFHRPNMQMAGGYDREIIGIANTYQSKYFEAIKYVSDSRGEWRFGHPCDCPEFKERRNMQVLIHPIWWIQAGKDNVSKLESYYASQVSDLHQEIAKNCIPFRSRVNALEVA